MSWGDDEFVVLLTATSLILQYFRSSRFAVLWGLRTSFRHPFYVQLCLLMYCDRNPCLWLLSILAKECPLDIRLMSNKFVFINRNLFSKPNYSAHYKPLYIYIHLLIQVYINGFAFHNVENINLLYKLMLSSFLNKNYMFKITCYFKTAVRYKISLIQ